MTGHLDAVCAAYAAAHGVQFGEPDAGLRQLRTAPLPGGGLVGVRAPLHETEQPAVRPLQIPGHGTFAIYIQGGVQHGLWKL